MEACFLLSFIKIHSAVAEKSKMSQSIRNQDGHVCREIENLKDNNGRMTIERQHLLEPSVQML